MIDPETLTQDQIAEWLKQRHGGDREWLANAMGFSAGALAHCFSTRGFSRHGRAIVAKLMELDEAAAMPSSLLDDVQLSVQQWERMEQARQAQGNPARPVSIRESIVWYTEKVLEDAAWDKLRHSAPKSDAYYDDGAEKDRAAEDGPETLGGQGEG